MLFCCLLSVPEVGGFATPRGLTRSSPVVHQFRRTAAQFAVVDDDGIVDKTEESSEASASSSRMKEKLRAESRYPFKFPLLGASAVIGGKGVTDALIKVIKVSIGFKGASLSEDFLGIPVLAIDVACVAVGLSLGSWTWTTMRDPQDT